ncbi:bifunctional glycosyltransferase/CDP-glycerol:glycerophosphate glycerophosphotransferase [Listeria valentina]|uniref:bifunctional glycosyltransferase/CDP-glycerol:glycerophosphate glycerophosphotransferase n=1 Tax=Listeria valentina TaxID=2705293 RepID=UPI00142FBF63|nr:CDP-glycerol glycerophosphotransferase family protein [Listeria valentina]
MEKQITIIVPVYNVEKYIPSCIESLVNQTIYENLEIILIDDHSEDKSYDFCVRSSQRFPNIHVYKNKGKGVASARNMGVQLAKTPFLMFVDSDDQLYPYTCFKLLNFITKHSLNIVMGDIEMFPSKTPNYVWKSLFGSGDRILDLESNGSKAIHCPSPCNKLFRTEWLKNQQFSFPEGMTFEDAFAVIPLMLKAKQIGLIDKAIYKYRKRDDSSSIMDQLFHKPQNFLDHLTVNEHLLEIQVETPRAKDEICQFVARTYSGFLNAFERNFNQFTEKQKKELYDRLVTLYQQVPFSFVSSLITTKNKWLYYSLYEEDWNTFKNGYYTTSVLHVRNQKIMLPLKRARVTSKLENVPFSIWIDFIENRESALRLTGEIVLPHVYLDTLRNRLNIVLNVDGKETLIEAKTFLRYDSLHVIGEGAVLGVYFDLPHSLLVQLDKNHVEQLVYRLEDESSLESVILPLRFSGMIGKFQGVYSTMNGKFRLVWRKEQKQLLIHPIKVWDSFKYQLSKIFNGRKLRVGGKLRLAYWLTKPYFFFRRNIVLVGERGDTFQDNGAHFFMYATHKDNYHYYIGEKGKPSYDQAAKYGKVIKKDSLKHYLYLLNAYQLINAYDVDAYMKPSNYSKEDYYNIFGDLLNYERVFIQHGIVYNDVYYPLSKYRTGYGKVLISNHYEKERFMRKGNYEESDLIETGLPRFDKLLEPVEEKADRKTLLIMPTWRADLAKKSYVKHSKETGELLEAFKRSTYFCFFNTLINSPKFLDFLNKYRLQCKFYLHYELQGFLDCFDKNSQIQFVQKEPIQDLLRQSDLLITDYSSVFFDFLYMKKPIVFVQFDRNSFFTTHYKMDYINFQSPFIGDVVYDLDGTLEALESLAIRQFGSKVDHQRIHHDFFTYCSGNNRSALWNALYPMTENHVKHSKKRMNEEASQRNATS